MICLPQNTAEICSTTTLCARKVEICMHRAGAPQHRMDQTGLPCKAGLSMMCSCTCKGDIEILNTAKNCSHFSAPKQAFAETFRSPDAALCWHFGPCCKSKPGDGHAMGMQWVAWQVHFWTWHCVLCRQPIRANGCCNTLFRSLPRVTGC